MGLPAGCDGFVSPPAIDVPPVETSPEPFPFSLTHCGSHNGSADGATVVRDPTVRYWSISDRRAGFGLTSLAISTLSLSPQGRESPAECVEVWSI